MIPLIKCLLGSSQVLALPANGDHSNGFLQPFCNICCRVSLLFGLVISDSDEDIKYILDFNPALSNTLMRFTLSNLRHMVYSLTIYPITMYEDRCFKQGSIYKLLSLQDVVKKSCKHHGHTRKL